MADKPTNRDLRLILGEAQERADPYSELIEWLRDAYDSIMPANGMPDAGRGNLGIMLQVRCPGCDAPPPLMIVNEALFAIRGRVDDLDEEIAPEMPVLAYRCECGTSYNLTARDLYLSG